jgi:RNA polymerase sigma factor (sigma-70 family)
VLQETLLAAYINRNSLKNADGFKPWLLRIAANKCNDYYRTRIKRQEIPADNDSVLENALSQSRYGLTVTETVHETLALLDSKDALLLRLVYIERLPQAEIARLLDIPVGTVKSRLHTAKKRFKSEYPYPPVNQQNMKGVRKMHKLPETMPNYTIVESDKQPFPIKWEETMGWFMVPKLGEKISWAMYDWPEKTRSEVYELEVVGKASVHGIEGVEIVAREHSGGQHEGMLENRNVTRTFVAQLTDTHCRFLAQSHYEGDVKRFYTFLDGDDFIDNWGFGEDNCGNEVNLKPKGIIKRNGSQIQAEDIPFLLDVVGRYTVIIGGKEYDCICVIDIETYNTGVLSEQFIDSNGRTVLWRRFNRDDWKQKTYKQPWSEKLPNNERLTVNGSLYVHWYDCITDYIL